MRRTTLAALCLSAVTVAGVAGCLPDENKSSGRASDKAEARAAAEPTGPFAGLTGGEIADGLWRPLPAPRRSV